ncbi:peptidase M61 [Tsuneonella deserti]|uniref:Peptidase M61 n=1 Tax=Tsuneonella deserti TaxID=2035528 RepID=A0ABQ1RZ69_9SPHN|nr:M61 family metallopeptidase [Tsuneonella deserti]GGD85992.1 peptidase M61 [Tsuneonella deserti]
MVVRLTLPFALLLTAVAAPAQVPGKSAPVAVAVPTATPVPVDAPWPGGTIDLAIDASDTRRGLYHVTETIPLPAGISELTLLYPEWLPGNHAARGPISQISDIRFLVDGKPVPWKRDPLDVFAFNVSVPKGAREVVARFVHTSPLQSSEGRITMTQEMLNLQWEKMSLYPAGHYTRKIAVRPKATFPKDWKVYTALDGQKRAGDTVTWTVTDYETLVDSPIFAGINAQSWDIGKDVRLDVVADKPAQLALAPQNLNAFRNLITEADALFGARHFDHYDMLLALTDRMGGIGLEHHRSAENQFEPTAFTDWDAMDWDHNVVAHELVHSWNGKFRRPADLWTPDYRTPMQGSLLWVYEGQTQFWGYVLAARSGIQSKETILGTLARNAATYSEGQPGRAWRDVGDTTNDPILSGRRPLPYGSLQRSEDYYTEGALTWLEADQIIRQGTGGAKGLDDFAKAFFGMRDGDWGELTYTFADVVSTLNGVYPYDWASFLTDRLLTPGRPPATRGLEMAGYKLAWRDVPNSFDKGRMDASKGLDLTYSLGVSLDKEGTVTSTLWDGPAFDAGIVNGAQIVAVDGEAYSADVIKAAITAAATKKAPVSLLVKRGSTYSTIPVDYHAGLRWPWLVPTGAGEQPLDRLLAPRVVK